MQVPGLLSLSPIAASDCALLATEPPLRSAALERDGDLQQALDLSDERGGGAADPAEQQYRLHSVVSHFGTGSLSGHYVADVFR